MVVGIFEAGVHLVPNGIDSARTVEAEVNGEWNKIKEDDRPRRKTPTTERRRMGTHNEEVSPSVLIKFSRQRRDLRHDAKRTSPVACSKLPEQVRLSLRKISGLMDLVLDLQRTGTPSA